MVSAKWIVDKQLGPASQMLSSWKGLSASVCLRAQLAFAEGDYRSHRDIRRHAVENPRRTRTRLEELREAISPRYR
jgi:hypothetical protein